VIAGVTARQIPGQVVLLREAEGLTQKELAERAGMTPDGVVKLESDQRRPTWETTLALWGDGRQLSPQALPTQQAKEATAHPAKIDSAHRWL
jgi:DNA-binding XRE family transcriptional regulator